MTHDPRTFSEHTAQIIDEEIAQILHDAEGRAQSILQEHRDKLDTLAKALLEKEIIDTDEIETLIGPSVNGADR